jgi:trafficking protein particle complex subunit 3
MTTAQKAARVGEEYVLFPLPMQNANKFESGCGSGFPEAPFSRSPGDWIADRLVRTRVDKVNAELVTLTYGTIVAQLCSDYDSDYVEVNKQLDRMGYNIGMRLIEDFFAKSNTGRCSNFKETAEVVSKVGKL